MMKFYMMGCAIGNTQQIYGVKDSCEPGYGEGDASPHPVSHLVAI